MVEVILVGQAALADLEPEPAFQSQRGPTTQLLWDQEVAEDHQPAQTLGYLVIIQYLAL